MSVASEAKNAAASKQTHGEALHQRVEIDSLVARFQKRLGNNWDEYQTCVSLFLVGKLSRQELMDQLDKVLDKTTIRLHNQLLLANLANCLRSEPLDGKSGASFGSSAKKRKGVRSSQYEMLKKDILSLPMKERKRLKAITRDAGKRNMTNSTMALTRQAALPKVPIVAPKPGTPQTKENITATFQQASKWAQDVSNGYKAPLASDNYELPEKENLLTRVLGIAREHGLVGSVSPDVADLLSLGLEYHLKAMLETALSVVRKRQPQADGASAAGATANASQQSKPRGKQTSRKRRRLTLTIEDMYDTMKMAPHLVEDCGSTYYMSDVMLRNDDDDEVVQLQRESVAAAAAAAAAAAKRHRPTARSSRTPKSQTPENIETTAEPVAEKPSPKKRSAISYLLKPKGSDRREQGDEEKDGAPRPNLALKDPSIGTPNELNWMLNDILAEQ